MLQLFDEKKYIDIIHEESCVYEAIYDASEIIKSHTALNSKKAYEGDLKYWKAWYEANHFYDPIKKEHIITFIIQHVEKMPENVHEILVMRKIKSNLNMTHKISTIKRRLKSLSFYLRIHELENPCLDRDVKILLRKLTIKHGESKPWGNAITLDILNDLLRTCEDNIFGVRDSAILLFGFSTGGRRRSEISNSMLENLTHNNDGNYIYKMGRSKTNQSGKEDIKPVVGRAARALTKWIDISKLSQGPIFRAISKSGKVIIDSGISDKQISRIVKLRCKKAGYNPSEFTAHSLRSGFVTEGGKKGKPIGDIMAMTGHRNVNQVMKYYQSGSILNNSAASLAD